MHQGLDCWILAMTLLVQKKVVLALFVHEAIRGEHIVFI